MTEKLFHGDETRWEVFEEVEGKTGHRWYLWVMQSVSVVYYRMAPGRGADVPKGHFAKLRKDLVEDRQNKRAFEPRAAARSAHDAGGWAACRMPQRRRWRKALGRCGASARPCHNCGRRGCYK
jgi:hypothetical protein